MLPSPILEIVASHLDAADRARFSCVCRATRNIDIRQEHIRAVVPSKKHAVLSFAKWFAARLKYVKHLELITDMTLWSYVWRYSGVKIALKLSSAHLYHQTGSPFVMHSPEDLIPTAPFLEHLMLCADGPVHIGAGLSRLRLKYLTVHSTSSFVTSEMMTFAIPPLEKMYLHGKLSESMSLYGLVSSFKLRYLECPAIMLASVIPDMESLESLVLHGGFPCTITAYRHISLKSKLKFVRLVQGHWCNLSWLPETVETLECVSCDQVNKLPKGLKNLLLLSTSINVFAAHAISKMNLDFFALRSFGHSLPMLSVRARVIDVSEEDQRFVTLLHDDCTNNT